MNKHQGTVSVHEVFCHVEALMLQKGSDVIHVTEEVSVSAVILKHGKNVNV